MVGIINTAVGLGCIFALKFYFGIADEPANLCGYVIGFTLSCMLNSRWTFRSGASFLYIAPRYGLAILTAYLANLLCVTLCIRFFRLNDYLSQAFGVIPYATVTYVLSRFLVFAESARGRQDSYAASDRLNGDLGDARGSNLGDSRK